MLYKWFSKFCQSHLFINKMIYNRIFCFLFLDDLEIDETDFLTREKMNLAITQLDSSIQDLEQLQKSSILNQVQGHHH